VAGNLFRNNENIIRCRSEIEDVTKEGGIVGMVMRINMTDFFCYSDNTTKPNMICHRINPSVMVVDVSSSAHPIRPCNRDVFFSSIANDTTTLTSHCVSTGANLPPIGVIEKANAGEKRMGLNWM
jgi:hypothetical protein